MAEMSEAAASWAREFEDFYRASYRPLVTVAIIAGAAPEGAEDIVQDVMVAMLRRWPEIEAKASYARVAVLNHVKNEFDQRRRDRHLVEQGDVPHAESGLDGRLTVWEDEQWVSQVLSRLQPSHRAVMEGILAELTSAEIGRLLGKSAAAVRQALRSARQKLKVMLAEVRPPEQPGGTRREEVP